MSKTVRYILKTYNYRIICKYINVSKYTMHSICLYKKSLHIQVLYIQLYRDDIQSYIGNTLHN